MGRQGMEKPMPTPDLSVFPITRKKVMDTLFALGLEPGWELHKGPGYFYFVQPKDSKETFYSLSVLTMRLSDQTLEDWVLDFRTLTGRGPDLKPVPKDPPPAQVVFTTSAGQFTIREKP